MSRFREALPSMQIVEAEKPMAVKPFINVPMGRLVELFGGEFGPDYWAHHDDKGLIWRNEHCEIKTYPAWEVPFRKGDVIPETRHFTRPPMEVKDYTGRPIGLEKLGYAEVDNKAIIAFPKKEIWPILSNDRYVEYNWIEISREEGFAYKSRRVNKTEEHLIPEAVIRASILTGLIEEAEIKARKDKDRRDKESHEAWLRKKACKR
jgi:hypothetical protein